MTIIGHLDTDERGLLKTIPWPSMAALGRSEDGFGNSSIDYATNASSTCPVDEIIGQNVNST
jgi:hypothetical protein